MQSFPRRHLSCGAAAAFAVFPAFGPEAWAQARDKLVLGMSLEPPVLDPNKNAAAAIREITYQNIYESLARIDRTGAIVPGLAESWTISPDGLVYTFKLRQGVKFHDGEALDASVVKFAIDRLFAADSTVPAKSLYTDIATVEAVDPATVKITLKTPNSYLLYNLALGDAGDHASQVGADQRQASGRHRPLHVQGAQGRRFDHAGEGADLSRRRHRSSSTP